MIASRWHVYILGCLKPGPLKEGEDAVYYYTGYTGNLRKRLIQHKRGYGCKTTDRFHGHVWPVYIQQCASKKAAIAREKQVKGYSRAKKEALIENYNVEEEDD